MLNIEALKRLKAAIENPPPGVELDQRAYLTEPCTDDDPIGLSIAGFAYLLECWAADAPKRACLLDMVRYGFEPEAAAEALGFPAGDLPPLFDLYEDGEEMDATAAAHKVGEVITQAEATQ